MESFPGWARFLAVLFACTAMFAPAVAVHSAVGASTESSAVYTVILTDGSKIPARTKPVSAFGKVRFMDASGKNRILSAKRVDLKKTRDQNSRITSTEQRGSLSVGGGVRGPAADESETTDDTTETEEKKVKRSVKVYSATWCPHCTRLKRFLAEKGIPASIIEVDLLGKAEQRRHHAEMKRLTGSVSYPTVVVGNQARAGFSPDWILKTSGH